MKYSFLDRPRPVITGLMAAETPQEFIARARNMEFDGAGAIAIELNYLKPESTFCWFGFFITIFRVDLNKQRFSSELVDS